MKTEKLSEDSDFKLLGPEFEPGPGWGKKLSVQMSKFISHRVFPFIAIFILIVGLYSFYPLLSQTSNNGQSEYQRAEFISVIVQPSDGFIKVARRALEQFLSQNSIFADKLSAEHKLFIEQFLYNKDRRVSVVAGQEVKISVNDIEEGIASALVLSEHSLKKWRGYLK